jgi:hypothetical protein
MEMSLRNVVPRATAIRVVLKNKKERRITKKGGIQNILSAYSTAESN